MKCAIVLTVSDFQALDEAYAFEYAFTSLAAAGLSEPFYVLIADGYSSIPAEFIERWRANRILVTDCSTVVRSLVRDYPYLERLSENPVYRTTLLRHLILERFFPGEAVLSADADIVWRVDPYKLFATWTGGYFAVGGSGFLTFANSANWFETYRLGLESAVTGGALTADFREAKFGISQILHDQHLIRHLESKGLMKNEWRSCSQLPELRELCIMANPLRPRQGFLEMPVTKLAFRKEGEREYFNDAYIPFWHMQSSFTNLCSFFFICRDLIQSRGGRLPFPRPKAGEDNLKTLLCHSIRNLLIKDRISGKDYARLKPLMHRRAVYKEFFRGTLPEELFTDQFWWEHGVFE